MATLRHRGGYSTLMCAPGDEEEGSDLGAANTHQLLLDISVNYD